MRDLRRDSRDSSGRSNDYFPSQAAHSDSSANTILTSANSSSTTRDTTHAISMLYTVCVVFIITLFPTTVVTTIQYIQQYTLASPQLYCHLKKVHMPLKMIRLSNYAVNCIIYGFTGRQFRRELRRLLHRVVDRWGYSSSSRPGAINLCELHPGNRSHKILRRPNHDNF